MTTLARWKTIFRHAQIASPGSPDIVLREHDPAAKLREVKIAGIDQETVIVHLRSRGAICSDLSDGDGIQSRCDYLLLQHHEDGLHVTFVELKSENIDKSRFERQFKASHCLVKYCQDLIHTFHGESTPLHTRFVLFHRAPSMSKRPTVPPTRPPTSSTEPEIIPNPGSIRLRKIF